MTNNLKKTVSIIIPAYNEECNIKQALIRIEEYLKNYKYDFEIIVIDDGSKDNTSEIVKKFREVKLIQNPRNQGKGYSVKIGILNSNKENILFLDADLSTPIEEIEKAFKWINKYDIVIGSRNLRDSNIVLDQMIHRRFMGKSFSYLVRMIAGLDFKDTQCGFKMIKNTAAKRIFAMTTINGWCFDVEMLFIAKKHGYRIKEIPITWIACPATSKVKIFQSSLEMFIDLLKIRLNDLKHRYTIYEN